MLYFFSSVNSVRGAVILWSILALSCGTIMPFSTAELHGDGANENDYCSFFYIVVNPSSSIYP